MWGARPSRRRPKARRFQGPSARRLRPAFPRHRRTGGRSFSRRAKTPSWVIASGMRSPASQCSRVRLPHSSKAAASACDRPRLSRAFSTATEPSVTANALAQRREPALRSAPLPCPSRPFRRACRVLGPPYSQIASTRASTIIALSSSLTPISISRRRLCTTAWMSS